MEQLKKESTAKIVWMTFYGFLVIPALMYSHRQFYSMDRSLATFLRQQVLQPKDEESNSMFFILNWIQR